MRYPPPLRRGDRIGITAPSSGVPQELRGRLDVAVGVLQARGYDVVLGECLSATTLVSAPAPERAAELMAMLLDPSIAAVVPPWGGEIGIDLLPLLDWTALQEAPATWVVGYSDTSTLLTPLTLLTGTATIHGSNLFDTPYLAPGGLAHWLDVAELDRGSTIEQHSPGRFRRGSHDDYALHPAVREWTLDGRGGWTRLDGAGDVDVSGRIVGGCIETHCNLAGTRFGRPSQLAADHPDDGLLVYVEAAEHDAASICRNLHGMRLAGFFDEARAVIVGRTQAPAFGHFSQHDAARDALAPLRVPIVADVECGHVPPLMPIVNGSLARLRLGHGVQQLVQQLC